MKRTLRQLEKLQRLGAVLQGRDPSAPPTVGLVEVSPGVWASPARRRRSSRLMEQAAELGELDRKLRRQFRDARDMLRKLGDL